MLTGEDIRNVRFNKSMGGYKVNEVDDFLDECAMTVDTLLREKDELSKKLEVLADKLVEYRNDEDNIRTALLSAQRLGDTVVREAKHKAGLILDDAKIKAEKIHDTARRDIQDEERELKRIQQEVANFKSKMLSLYREHLSLIDVLPEPEKEATASPPAAQTEEPSVETEAAPAQSPAVSEQAAVEPPADAPAEAVFETPAVSAPSAPETEAVPAAAQSSRFGELQFGDNYHVDTEQNEDASAGGFFRRRR